MRPATFCSRVAALLAGVAGLLLLALARTIVSSLLHDGWLKWSAGCRDRADVEPLHRAVLRGDLSTVKSIIDRDPGCVNAADETGMTPLHFTVARLRVSPYASVGPGIGGREQALARASFTSYDLQDLRLRGPGSARIDDSTTIDYAPFAQYLIGRGATVDARERALARTPLHLAMLLGHKGVAEVLLAHGADINAADAHGLTAIHVTAMSGNIAMARVALRHGADPNAKVAAATGLLGWFGLEPFLGDTPLALAASCNQAEMVEFLLANGADPNIRLREGFTVLQMASSPEIVRALLARGARPEGRGYEDRTPLWQAVMRGQTETAELLLSRGADIEAKDKNGDTPLIASLNSTAELKREATVALLLRHHAQVNVRGSDGNTPLHIAVRRGRIELVRMLLDAGADINAGNRWKLTPLHLAVEKRNRALVQLLLARGAQVNARDDQGRTPLYYTWGGSADDRKIAEVLTAHGAVQRR